MVHVSTPLCPKCELGAFKIMRKQLLGGGGPVDFVVCAECLTVVGVLPTTEQ